MQYVYGTFSAKQVLWTVRSMHNDIHRLLLYKDKKTENKIFETDEDFFTYFTNLLYRFGGLNQLLGEPLEMTCFMSTLQAAYNLIQSPNYEYRDFRKLILDAHGYLNAMFGEVRENAES